MSDQKEWDDRVSSSGVFVYSEILGRIVRAGSLPDQAISNVVKTLVALSDGKLVEAAAYGRVFRDEAALVRGLIEGALRDIRAELRSRDMAAEEIAQRETDIAKLLVLPDGDPFIPALMWDAFLAQVSAFNDDCRLGRVEQAMHRVPVLKESWRRLHDRLVDSLSGLLNVVVQTYGEEAIHETWVRLNAPIFAERYSQYDVSHEPWDRALEGLLYITFESSRAHLVGPARTGDCEFEDEGDRWVWRWDPCGTCGRTIRGDDIEGTPPRMQTPYNWPVLTQAYDWSWSKAGVSPYGVQACIKLAQMGIDHFGYPIRVVDCPTYPDERRRKCVRYVYKDPTQVPGEYYEQVGRVKPTAFGSKGRDR